MQLDSRLRCITAKGHKLKSVKGKKVHEVTSRGSQAPASRPFSQWSHTGHAEFLQQSVVTMRVKCRHLEELVRDSVLRDFTGGRAHGHLLPSAYKNSRLVEGEQVFVHHKTLCLYKQYKHSELFSIRARREPSPNPKFLGTSQEPRRPS